MNAGKISDTTCYDYKAFIFNRTCLGTDTNTGVSILCISQERYK